MYQDKDDDVLKSIYRRISENRVFVGGNFDQDMQLCVALTQLHVTLDGSGRKINRKGLVAVFKDAENVNPSVIFWSQQTFKFVTYRKGNKNEERYYSAKIQSLLREGDN